MPDFSYPKAEKLKQKREIDFLFAKGRWKTHGNLRIITVNSSDFPSENQQLKPKIGVSVSKKFYKKATDRNRVKRQLREVYRLNKDVFAEAFGTDCFAMLFWVSNKKPENFLTLQNEFLNICKPKEKPQN